MDLIRGVAFGEMDLISGVASVITFSLVIFSFISGNIPAARVYGGNISQLVSHTRLR
jgi:hypothetical protein